MGGQKSLKQVMRLLRLLDNKQQPTAPEHDPVLMSIDLEVSRGERAAMLKSQSHIPYIKELGIAILDVRDIFSRPTPQPHKRTNLVVTRQYSTEHSSEDFEDCDLTDFPECVFAKTVRIRQVDVVPTIERCLEVPESVEGPVPSGPRQLRPILLVGHSIMYDLIVLQRLGLDLANSYPVVGVLDTHPLSRHILAPGRFTLAAVLSRLGCSYEARELHNAGNDATYTLFAVLLLAVTWARQREPTQAQEDSLQLILAFAHDEMEASRWKPVRRALGARRQES